MKRFLSGFLSLLFDFFWLIAFVLFGWEPQQYKMQNKFIVKLKENVRSIYQRKLPIELRFFFS